MEAKQPLAFNTNLILRAVPLINAGVILVTGPPFPEQPTSRCRWTYSFYLLGPTGFHLLNAPKEHVPILLLYLSLSPILMPAHRRGYG